ncbi:hypothetical protein ABZ477_16030 [Microbacterium sp. NPDC019599]|uniref:hypothetical protein n=1 Tax=Microbacterium sp. NPDC019599 TaxID=3154690 RepID=UPI0033FC8A0D
MDGSSSAPGSEHESIERMTPSRPSDTERELSTLRVRAYGPQPDIDADPAAMARLIELEATRVASATPVHVTEPASPRVADDSSPAASAGESSTPAHAASTQEAMLETAPPTSRGSVVRSLRQRATATRSRAWFLVGAIVVVAILIYTATWFVVPHPDATLQPITGEMDDGVIQVLINLEQDPNSSTLRQFEGYHDIDVWSVDVSSIENGLGTCLVAWDRADGRFQYECLPPGIDLAVHMSVIAEADDGFGEWLADNSVISLHLRKNTVDVFVHPPLGNT